MDNIVTISNVKTNVLEFDADIQGLDTADMSVKFIINANGMNIGFDAQPLHGTKWEVTIPPIPMLERTAYPFHMDVTSDGYFFEPLQGTINVVGSHDVYVSSPIKKVSAPESPPRLTAVEEKTKPSETKTDTEKLTTKFKLPEPRVIGEKKISKPYKTASAGSTKNNDTIKKILTKSQTQTKVSLPISESPTIKLKPIIQKKVAEAKPPVVAETKKKETKKTKQQTKVDNIVKEALKSTKTKSETEATNPVNSLKKLSD